MNTLVVKLSAIGDVVHTLPSLAALRKLYPEANITWVVEDASSDILAGHPYIDRLIVSHRKQWIEDVKRSRFTKAAREIRAFLRELKRQPYDLVIDFQGLMKSAVLVLLSTGKRKLGYESMQEMSGLFLNEKIPEDMNKHAIDRYLDFLRYLGADIRKPEFLIPIGQENVDRVDELLRRNGIDRKDAFVAVSPVALWETKLWPDEKFALLCDSIVEELKLSVVFTGAERGRLERIRKRMHSPAVNLGGETKLRDLARLYQRSSLLVTTDSGPMHIAAAVGTPVVALFGPTDPSRTGPCGEGHVVIRKKLACSPCFLKKCDSARCMTDITVEEVFHAVRKNC